MLSSCYHSTSDRINKIPEWGATCVGKVDGPCFKLSTSFRTDTSDSPHSLIPLPSSLTPSLRPLTQTLHSPSHSPPHPLYPHPLTQPTFSPFHSALSPLLTPSLSPLTQTLKYPLTHPLTHPRTHPLPLTPSLNAPNRLIKTLKLLVDIYNTIFTLLYFGVNIA